MANADYMYVCILNLLASQIPKKFYSLEDMLRYYVLPLVSY
jgi:hypothetical protein